MSTSSVSTTPYFGRAWKLQLLTSAGVTLTVGNQSFDIDDNSLKVSFETNVTTTQQYGFADISIYNLNQNTQQALIDAQTSLPWSFNSPIEQGNFVTLFAGYQANFAAQPLPLAFTNAGFQPTGLVETNSGVQSPSGSGSLIWTGQVFQPLWERQNVVDFKLTLHCIIGYVQDVQNFIAFPVGTGSTQIQILEKIAGEATNGIAIDSIGDLQNASAATSPLPRGKVVFGRPGDYLNAIARSNNLLYYLGPNGINVRTLNPPSGQTTPDLVYGPSWPPGKNVTIPEQTAGQYTPTLIGTPRQTQKGVEFRVLMDSRVRLGSVVQLNMSAIQQLPQYPGQYRSILDQDNTYVVCGIKHIGDTWGDDWFTDITAVNNTFWPTYAQTSWIPATNN